MTLADGALVLHLGELDESLVRLQDFYLCIRSSASNVSAKLHACWRTSISDSIVYHELDPEKRESIVSIERLHFLKTSFRTTDPITPLSLEMIAEDLPHLLQTLLVGVERAIRRIPLDELTFPPCTAVSGCSDHNVIECCTPDCLMDAKNAASKRADCNLKRRELITKNNSINKKYAIKRITCSGTTTNESEAVDEEAVEHRTRELTASTNSYGVVSSNADISAESENDSLTGAVASTLPLFCLGGSFPHIDSDEESGDDARKIQSGKSLSYLALNC